MHVAFNRSNASRRRPWPRAERAVELAVVIEAAGQDRHLEGAALVFAGQHGAGHGQAGSRGMTVRCYWLQFARRYCDAVWPTTLRNRRLK